MNPQIGVFKSSPHALFTKSKMSDFLEHINVRMKQPSQVSGPVAGRLCSTHTQMHYTFSAVPRAL